MITHVRHVQLAAGILRNGGRNNERMGCTVMHPCSPVLGTLARLALRLAFKIGLALLGQGLASSTGACAQERAVSLKLK